MHTKKRVRPFPFKSDTFKGCACWEGLVGGRRNQDSETSQPCIKRRAASSEYREGRTSRVSLKTRDRGKRSSCLVQNKTAAQFLLLS